MVEDVLSDAETRMKKSIEALHHHLQTIRTGRAQPALIERVQVEYYGVNTNLRELATISAPEPRLLMVQPFDRNSFGAIEKALQKSELGLNPTNDGKVIRIAIPQLTTDRRRDLTKLVKSHVEEAHVAIRNIRRDALNDLKEFEKEKLISEDDHKRAEEKVQHLVDKYIKEADQVGSVKEQELLEV
jgi:ribosome recycling factor